MDAAVNRWVIGWPRCQLQSRARMAVNQVFWNNGEGYDIHVVAGASSRTLNDLLGIEHGNPPFFIRANDPARPATMAVKFRAAFNGAVVATTPNFTGFGVTVNQDTGAVSVLNPLNPVPFLRNFLIHAEVTDSSVAPAKTFVAKIRVHVHTTVTRVWLTPRPLTIHRGADGQRFSVLAEFSDQTVGDITRIPGLAWVSGTPANIAVDPGTGELRALVDAAGADITVTLPAAWGGAAATAHCNPLPSWST